MVNSVIRLFVFVLVVGFFSIANASTTIDAQVVRNQTGSGTTQISAGFPFPPGLVTETMITNRTIKVTVGGSEVAANVSALRGRHSDGTIRSALIQFTRTMAQNDVATAQVIVDGGTRTNTDPAYVRPTWTMVQNNNVILPTDPDYLTTTLITFQRLLPTGDGSTAEELQYTSLADDRFDALVASPNMGTASYENARAMLTLWARSGNKKYFNQAVAHTVTWLPYNTPGSGASPDCNADAYVNPDGRTPEDNTYCALPAEQYQPRMLSYASMYLLTGYRDFWSVVAYSVQFQQNDITSESAANTLVIAKGDYDTPRFNYSFKYGSLLAALMIDATMPISGQWFSGRQATWSDQLIWTLGALKTHEWDLQWIPFNSGTGTVPAAGTTISRSGVSATLLGVYTSKFDPQNYAGTTMPSTGYLQVNGVTGGTFSAGALTGISASATGANASDYRQGLVGIRSNSPRVANYWEEGPAEVVVPSFQLVFPTNFLIDYYLNVNADSRIPGMVKKNLDIILSQMRLMTSGDTFYNADGGTWGDPIYGKPYKLENPVDTANATPWELPEYARFIAFVLKTVGNDTVNGADYNTWYSRLIDTANNSPVGVLIWQWKLFGQYYGFGADTPWIMAQTSLPAPTYREPTYYASIPGDTPDLQGEEGGGGGSIGRHYRIKGVNFD